MRLDEMLWMRERWLDVWFQSHTHDIKLPLEIIMLNGERKLLGFFDIVHFGISVKDVGISANKWHGKKLG